MSYIGNTSTTQSFTPAVDYFSGNASTTAFILSRPVASVAQVQVVVNNVAQNPSSAYTISSNTITFTSAPSSGTNNIYVYYTSPITQVIAPGQGTVGLTQLTATGTASSSTYLRGDNTWATVTTPSAATPTALGTVVGQTTVNASPYTTALGYQAASGNTSGTNITAIGYQSGASATAGPNTFVGSASGGGVSSGTNNVAVGWRNLGYGGAGTTGGNNACVGDQSLYSITTGASNVAIGYQTGYTLATGSYNIYIGYQTGNNTKTSGVDCIYIGRTITPNNAGVNGEMVINTNGNNATGKGDGTGFITTGGNLYNGLNTSAWQTISDRRLKKNIVDNTEGLDKIAQIRVRNFEYRLPEEITELQPQDAVKKSGVQLGVIAQELQEVCSDCVKEESTGVLSINSDNITWHLINAVKDLKAINDALTARIEALENK